MINAPIQHVSLGTLPTFIAVAAVILGYPQFPILIVWWIASLAVLLAMCHEIQAGFCQELNVNLLTIKAPRT
jgi:hypothetical protein